MNNGKRVTFPIIPGELTIYTDGCDILVVNIPKIKVCNNSPFRRTCFVTSLTKQCYVLFEIAFFVFFSLSYICSSLFRITNGSKQVK